MLNTIVAWICCISIFLSLNACFAQPVTDVLYFQKPLNVFFQDSTLYLFDRLNKEILIYNIQGEEIGRRCFVSDEVTDSSCRPFRFFYPYLNYFQKSGNEISVSFLGASVNSLNSNAYYKIFFNQSPLFANTHFLVSINRGVLIELWDYFLFRQPQKIVFNVWSWDRTLSKSSKRLSRYNRIIKIKFPFELLKTGNRLVAHFRRALVGLTNHTLYFSSNYGSKIYAYDWKNRKMTTFGEKGKHFNEELIKNAKTWTDFSYKVPIYYQLYIDTLNRLIYRTYKLECTGEIDIDTSPLSDLYLQVYRLDDLSFLGEFRCNFFHRMYPPSIIGSENGKIWLVSIRNQTVVYSLSIEEIMKLLAK